MPQWLIPTGRVFYAIGLMGSGIQHWIFADFIPVIVPLPGNAVPAYAAGAENEALAFSGIAFILAARAYQSKY